MPTIAMVWISHKPSEARKVIPVHSCPAVVCDVHSVLQLSNVAPVVVE